MGTINPHFEVNRIPGAYSYLIHPNHPATYDAPYRETVKETGREKENILVILINSVYYFLECVYILKKRDNFHLVAIHNGRVLTYRSYGSLKGAKIAFQKIYRDKAWQMGVKAQWTHPYQADTDWLEEKDEILSHSMPKEPLKAYSI